MTNTTKQTEGDTEYKKGPIPFFVIMKIGYFCTHPFNNLDQLYSHKDHKAITLLM